MFEAYRVRKPFMWNGYQYTPEGACKCGCAVANSHGVMLQCTNSYATECQPCRDSNCKCQCTITKELHGGSIWIVEAGHPRKEAMLEKRLGYFACGDASIPNIDELLKEDRYKRLLVPVKVNPEFATVIDRANRKHNRSS